MVTWSIYFIKHLGRSLPNALPFSLPPYPLTLSTPATQASEFFNFLSHFE